MPDYTEDDVERVARALYEFSPASKRRDGSIRQTFENLSETFPEAAQNWRDAARIAVDLMAPAAYTAGALAMREADVAALRAQEQAYRENHRAHRIEYDLIMADAAQNFQALIRALPVPPRGSKI